MRQDRQHHLGRGNGHAAVGAAEELNRAGHDTRFAEELFPRARDALLMGGRQRLHHGAIAVADHGHRNGHVVEDGVGGRRDEQVPANGIERAIGTDHRTDLRLLLLNPALVPVVEVLRARQHGTVAH